VRRVRRLFELSGHERSLLLQALLMLPLARLSLALCGFNRTHRLFQRLAPVGPRAFDEREAQNIALATARMVRVAAANGVCRATCLPRSLATWALLRRLGLHPDLRLGARKKDGAAIEAHAWVALGALAIGDETGDDGEPFSPFAVGNLLDEHDNATC
jgi:hypothetical protein